MLGFVVATILSFAAPQRPAPPAIDAMVVRGEAELSSAEAFASARERAEELLRDRWRRRAARIVEGRRPFWVPSWLADDRIGDWLADLPDRGVLRVVDREDRERIHEFGNSYQTTLWVVEDPEFAEVGERELRTTLRRVERASVVRYGSVLAVWAALALAVGWIDRLSRGYMSGRLRLLGAVGGVAFPVLAFLV